MRLTTMTLAAGAMALAAACSDGADEAADADSGMVANDAVAETEDAAEAVEDAAAMSDPQDAEAAFEDAEAEIAEAAEAVEDAVAAAAEEAEAEMGGMDDSEFEPPMDEPMDAPSPE